MPAANSGRQATHSADGFHPFRNLSLKLVSTLVAFLLWLVVAGERVVERVMRAPVEFQNLPAGLELVGNPPDTVEVRLRGLSGALSRMAPGDMSAVLDLSTARPGRRLFHITASHVTVPYDTEIVQVGPSTLTVEFEMSGIRRVPVEPDVDGRRRRYEVTDVKSDPETVEVAGPESALKRFRRRLRTGNSHRRNATRSRSRDDWRAGREPPVSDAADRGRHRDDLPKETMKLLGRWHSGKAGHAPLVPETVARVGAALVKAMPGRGPGS